MPHPQGWAEADPTALPVESRHQREGFANRDACFRCHYDGDDIFVGSEKSCSCHGLLGTMHGGKAWIREHSLQATGQKTGQFADCRLCHGGNWCAYCHPPAYNELLNPRLGPDEYTRDVPLPPDYFDF